MQQKLAELKELFISELKTIQEVHQLEELGKEFLGKKGKLKAILAGIKDLSPEEKKII
jgi:phenylalanyl-tRNA synthetase alpha chain